MINSAGIVISPPKSTAPIVTYVSRQNGVRSFSPEAHNGLVTALRKLEEEGICHFDVVAMEDLTFSKQVEIVARTTASRSLLVLVRIQSNILSSQIMVGIHGNGLTVCIYLSGPRF